MPETPDAVQAGVDAVMAKEWEPDAPWSVHSKHQYDSGCAVCQEDVPAVVAAALEAAAPFIAAQVRRETAKQLATAIVGTPKPPEAYWRAWAARIARNIGEARPERANHA